MPFYSYLCSALKRCQSKIQHSLIPYLYTYITFIPFSSGKNVACRALLWLGWTYCCGGAGTPCQHPKTRAAGPAGPPCTYPTLIPQVAGENGSSGQVATTKAITADHIQSLFLEHSSSAGLPADWVASAAAAPHWSSDQADKVSPHRLVLRKFNSDNHVESLNVHLWETRSQPFSSLIPFTATGKITLRSFLSCKIAYSRLQWINKAYINRVHMLPVN